MDKAAKMQMGTGPSTGSGNKSQKHIRAKSLVSCLPFFFSLSVSYSSFIHSGALLAPS